MGKNDTELMRGHLEKLYNVFYAVVALITIMELVLMIRGIFFFDLERLKLRLYLYSYIFLFVSSLLTLLIIFVCRDLKKHLNKCVCMIYIYGSCLVLWSAFVTCIDCYANGDSGVIVYVMTCISVGILTLIKPIFFIPLLGGSSIAMLTVIYFAKGEFYSSGFYINFFVFIALAIFINIHNYHLSMREHEKGKLLEVLSYTDQLTGVYNRRRLDENITTLIDCDDAFTFVLMDIDNFKVVNDTSGHATGDKCLIMLSEKLTEKFGDSVYRFGGDEFAIISSRGEKESCFLLDEINRELSSSAEGIDFHISAGVYTVLPKDTPGEVFKKTDKALYDAKKQGKCRCAVYNS